MLKLSLIPPQAYWIAIGVLAMGIGGQQLRVAGLKTDVAAAGTALAQEKQAHSDETAARAALALTHARQIAALQADHASKTQTKENEYAAKIKELEIDRTAGVATAMRLRDRIATYAAGDRRPGETDAAAVQRCTDRLGVVSGLLAESVDLVVEGRAVIVRRDAEVAHLVGQIRIDRAACTSTGTE